MAKYSVTQWAVSQLLADVRGEKIAIPELQRPFVWDSVKVRDLMDSLYKGYSVGYLITWQSVGAKLKDGQVAAHQLGCVLGGCTPRIAGNDKHDQPVLPNVPRSAGANNSRGFLSKGITVAAMHQQSGDIHHVVPKDYLQKNGLPDRGDYNQVANFALAETSINISISNKPPADYMAEAAEQIESGALKLGEITDADDLTRNLAENAVPAHVAGVTAGSYREFLSERRHLMAAIIRHYLLMAVR